MGAQRQKNSQEIYQERVEKIERKIAAINYCSKDSDCVDAAIGCPFGCYNFVNKNEKRKIREIQKEYESLRESGESCDYRCRIMSEAKCVEDVCQVYYK